MVILVLYVVVAAIISRVVVEWFSLRVQLSRVGIRIFRVLLLLILVLVMIVLRSYHV